MKESVYKSYDELPLFLNRTAETMANAIIAALSEFPPVLLSPSPAPRVLSQRQKPFQSFPCHPKKEPGVDQRQAKKILGFQKSVELFHLSLKNCCT